MLADLDAERLAFVRVFRAGITARTDEACRPGCHRKAPLVECKHRDLESFARLPDQVVCGYFDVVHLEKSRIARLDAPFLRQRSARESLERPLDDESAES